MMYNVYAIKDKKSTFSTDLLVLPSDELAKRYFGNLIQNLSNSSDVPLIIRYPDDFDLYRIGHYDCDNGSISSCQPCFICGASSFLKVGE